MKVLKITSSLLLVIGGIHLGLQGVLDLDIIHMLFGGFGNLTNILFGLIGLSAVNYIIEGNLFDA